MKSRDAAERLVQGSRILEAVAPRQVRRLGDADARTHRNLGDTAARLQHEIRRREPRAVLLARDGERLAESTRPRAQKLLRALTAPAAHGGETVGRLKRAQQHGAAASFRLADEVHA